MSPFRASEVADVIRDHRVRLQDSWEDQSLVLGAASRRRASTQAKLLVAARRLICEQGLGSISVGDVAAAAGFTRGAFYSNFEDMDALVRRLAHDEFDKLLRKIEGVVRETKLPPPDSSKDDTDQAIGRFVQALVPMVYLDKDTYLFYAEVGLYAGRRPGNSPQLRQILSAFYDTLCALVSALQDALNLESVLDTMDQVRVLMAVFERSAADAVIIGDDECCGLVSRTLAPVISGIVRIKSPQADG